jgi:hypothetical protein
MEDLARDLSRVIREVSDLLGDDSASAEEELSSVVKEMPRIDLGSGKLHLTRPWTMAISPWLATRTVEKHLRDAAGEQIKESFSTYGSMLDAWSRRVAGELQLRFNSYADAHRARLSRLSGASTGEDILSLRAALQEIGSPFDLDARRGTPVPMGAQE